jgi:hypothetical protein
MTRKAVEHLEALLSLNAQNKDYYLQILQASEIDMSNEEKVVEILNKYEESLPKSNAHVRLALDLISAGPVFEQKLLKYMRPLVIKGVPSLIRALRTLYQDEAKRDTIGKYLLQMCESMEQERVLFKDDEQEQDPTVLLWLYFFIS